MKDAQLSQAQQHTYAMKVQHAWHWQGYSPAQQAQILVRVRQLVERNPNGYLARIWRQVYR